MTKAHYNTPVELQFKVDEYFKLHTENQRYTMAGLALHLGFESRQSLYDYKKKTDYSYIIKTAKFKVEQRLEELMYYGKKNPDINLAGIMLGLKTHAGYTDRQVDTGANKDPASDVDVPARMSQDEWVKRQEEKNAKTN